MSIDTDRWMFRVAVAAIALGILCTVVLIGAHPTDAAPIPPLHPVFPLLDVAGNNVLDSGQPVSTLRTCGSCHDTAFIATHSFHADLGLSDFTSPGAVDGGNIWDTSPGAFGKWDPLTYRYLSPTGDEIVDLTTVEWIKTLGGRHVGGGPAAVSRDGRPLVDLPADPDNPETSVVDPVTGERTAWDWNESGVVEMNCFLCHLDAPNNEARLATLAAGNFGWANTMTLLGTGILTGSVEAPIWNADAFDADGNLLPAYVTVQDPTSANCGQCHGDVHTNNREPLVLDDCTDNGWSTTTTGQVFSSQRLASSGLNLQGKNDLSLAWDVHAERVVTCTECHYSINNPVYYQEDPASRPNHLVFDPRRIDLGEYIYRPIHEFAKGQSAQGILAPQFDNTLRRCESCHSVDDNHTWLPYSDRHMEAVSCETCHIPKLYAPAQQWVDWTVLRLDGSPQTECRGIEQGDGSAPLLTGYTPTLLPRADGEGGDSLAPHNLIASWYWIYGNPARPVPLRNLTAAWLDGSSYRSDVLATFDINSDGQLDDVELIIDSEAKRSLIAENLASQGLQNPRIEGDVQPYSINHNVVTGAWATRSCDTCHGEGSLITQVMPIANRLPGGVLPTLTSDDLVQMPGILKVDDGALIYAPTSNELGSSDLYILGHDSVYWVDWIGMILFLGTLLGVTLHGSLRYLGNRRYTHQRQQLREVYMYTIYERFWHWMQTGVILGLIGTGLIIHKPDKLSIFSFAYIVQVHNVLAAILLINAALAAFYHIASGEIQKFLPQPRGFFNAAVIQVKFYLSGIFRGEAHPFEKSPSRKFNPLQQITYLAILNVLLPLQVITGVLMWGAQHWPGIAAQLGDLVYLAPFHTLIAWLFPAFLVLHIYLTTTGPTPLTGIRSMIVGWDEVEIHPERARELGDRPFSV
jgi:thiosulfate reductase cytochrome b subunit